MGLLSRDDCPDCAPPTSLSRRNALRLGGLAVAAAGLGLAAGAPARAAAAAAAAEVSPGLRVHPRSAWAGDLSPKGRLEPEAPGDVRFLLVHHTASSNAYGPGDVAAQLRSFFRFHTSPDKGWPDIAYNFLIDQYGGVWEGRSGSLDAPVKADATGGSQGYAQLACFIGDLSASPPTDAARASMLRVLAWLAHRYDVDTSPGATATFASRGSNRHPPGTTVVTATIAGHRDMSQTSCPGDAVYGQVRELFPAEVTALRATVHPTPAPSPAAAAAAEPSPVAPPPPTPEPLAPPVESPAPPVDSPTTTASPTAAPSPAAAASPTGTASLGLPVDPAVGAGLTAAAVGATGAGLVWRRRRSSLDPSPGTVEQDRLRSSAS